MQLKKNIALSDSGFIFNPSTGDSFSVNPIGMEILKLMKEGKNDDNIIAIILDKYRIDKDSVEKDLYDFKKMLETYKLVQVNEKKIKICRNQPIP